MKISPYLLLELVLYALAAIAITAIAMSMGGCVSRFYDRGQMTAEIQGDYTYQRTKDGAVSITLKHSPVITSAGTASTKIITSTGTAASAALLAR